jgi:predicted TIM-barrel fold metal-dependent hydrolase
MAKQPDYRRLLSAGYIFGFSEASLAPEDIARLMRAENQFNVDQALASNGRLVAMVGINPFLDNAMVELDYWSQKPGAVGVKLHLGNSGLDPGNPDQAEAIAAFFTAASKARMPLAVHLRGGASFTHANITIFIDTVLSQAGDLPVQIAHGGSFGGIDATTIEALKLYGDAIARSARHSQPGARSLRCCSA